MANVIMQTSNYAEAMRDIYSRIVVEAARANLIFDQTVIDIWNEPAAENGDIVYRNINKPHKPTPGPLLETTDPDSTPLSAYRISIRVREHGDTIQLSEKLRRLSYQKPVAQRLTEVGWGMGTTMDKHCMWAYLAGTHSTYANSKSARSALTEGDSVTSTIVRQAVRNLRRRNASPWGGAGGYWLGLIHPDLAYDITGSSDWKDPHTYVDTEGIYRNEIGMWYGVRFIESTEAVLKNAGLASVSTYLSADIAKLATTFTVADASSLSAGDVITLGVPGVVDMTDETFDASTEEIEIGSISGSTITLATDQYMQFAHSSGDLVTLGKDIHPLVICGPGGVARAQALYPELRVQQPIDKLQRLNSLGWYGLYGYGVARDWQIEIYECCASA